MMNKQVKVGIFVLVIGLLLLTILFLCFNKFTSKNNVSNLNNLNGSEGRNGENMENLKIKLMINNYELTAALYDNSSTRALMQELQKGPITVEMSDYANMEKVGDLGVTLPQNNENIITGAGDLILYQGNNFVIYYDTNHWSLTRLGKIDNLDEQELKNILGSGNVTVILSLK